MRKAAGGCCTNTRMSITTIQDRFVGRNLSGVSVPGASGNARRKAAAGAGRGVIRTFIILVAWFFVAVTSTSTEWQHIGVVVGGVEVAHCFCFLINACRVQATSNKQDLVSFHSEFIDVP